MNAAQSRRLLDLLSLPTAPFREGAIVRHAKKFCTRFGLPYFADDTGNLVIGAADAKTYRRLITSKTREPLRVFIAHMDHPGFHGERWISPSRLAIRWHGGSPTKHVQGARVWLADDTGYAGEGRLANVKLHRAGYSITTAEIRVDGRDLNSQKAGDFFGGFAFRTPAWKSGKTIYTKAADDLGGVFAVLESAKALKNTREGKSFIGLLTRAEEVGFVGAIAHFDKLPYQNANRPIVCVSLETSRTLPGAVIGKGPVVRLGDRRGVFNADALRLFSDLALDALPKRHQRRIMDGGACEATAALAYGLPAIGISVPLGNYHNQGFEGGPDCRKKLGPAPEFVHLDDLDGMLKLCRALMRPGLPWGDPWKPQRIRLRRNLARYRKLLSRPAI